MLFRDRAEGGRVLAGGLLGYAGRSDVLVLGLPRGGVPVAFEVARALGAPLDVFVVRKLGVPGQPELAMGAIASGGIQLLDAEVVRELGIPDAQVAGVVERERRELERRERLYRREGRGPDVRGRIVILVDDGLATGSTMRAAVRAIRQQGPARIVVAVPVGAAGPCRELGEEVDEIVCAATPADFHSVGLWYQDFSQTTDDEVRALLSQAPQRRETESSRPSRSPFGDGGPS